MNTPDTPNRPTRIVGHHATAAEIDASMLEDLRQWHERQDPRRLAEHGARLTGDELDMLLRVAAERDDLLLEARGRAAEDAAARIGEAVADAFDPYAPLDFSGHTPAEPAVNFIPAERDAGGTWRYSAPEHPECTHVGHISTEGGATVCGACGRLLAWVRG